MASHRTPPHAKWLALAGVGMGTFMSALDVSIVNISLPTLVEQLKTNFATVQWVMLAYLLMTASLILSVTRAGDMIGKKRVYMAGMALFIVGSALCGISPSIHALIAFRALQGMGGVALTGLGMAIVTEVFPPEERGKAIGIMGGIVSVGIATGPALGGLLIGLVNWHSIFLINLPVGALALLIIWRIVPQSKNVDRGKRFDLAGAFSFLVAMASFAMGMTLAQQAGFSSPGVIALLGLSAVMFSVFITIEKRAKFPMLQLSFFNNTLFSISLAMGLLLFIVVGSTFLFPFYLELVKGLPTESVGMMIIIQPMMMGLVAPVAGTLSDRYGSRKISILGLVFTAIACLGLSTVTTETSVAGFVLRLAPLGIGLGLFNSPNNSAVLGAVPPVHLGVTSGLLALSRLLGQLIGIPILSTVFTGLVLGAGKLPVGTAVDTAPPAALVFGFVWTYRIAAIIILVATGLAVKALQIDEQRKKSEALAATK